MSRLMADQESRGGDGDSGAGEENSVMRVNLAEGYWAVNDQACRPLKESAGLSCSFGSFGSKNERNQTHQRNQTDQITRQTGPVPPVPCGELCSLDAFLYKE
jgi:hypothetical protein